MLFIENVILLAKNTIPRIPSLTCYVSLVSAHNPYDHLTIPTPAHNLVGTPPGQPAYGGTMFSVLVHDSLTDFDDTDRSVDAAQRDDVVSSRAEARMGEREERRGRIRVDRLGESAEVVKG